MRCLSVRPSRSCILWKWTNISSNVFHRRVTRPLSIPNLENTATGTPPLTEASNAGGWQNSDFRHTSRFISEMIPDSAIVTGNPNRILCALCRTVPFLLTLNDPYSDSKVTLTISETVRDADIVTTYLHAPHSTVSLRMILSDLSDLEWFSDIFNDTKHRAASLRQLSFL